MGMDEGTEGGRPSNNLQRDNSKDAERQVVAIADAIAPSLVFNNVALPPNLPDHLKSALLTKADQAREAAIDAGFVRPSAIDGVASISREERQRREDEKNTEYLGVVMAQEERRRREWEQSQITIGGVAMSGEEWDDAYQLLSDPRLRDQLVQNVMRKKGWSQDRAEKAADDALTLAQIAQKEKDGTMTSADRARADDTARRNPDAAVMAKEAAEFSHSRGLEVEGRTTLSSQSRLSGDIKIATNAQIESVQNAASEIHEGDDHAFASAPSLGSAFDAARNAALASQVEEAKVKPLPPRPLAAVDISGPY